MDDHVYKVIEIVGTSKDGIEPAIRNALTRASASVKQMRWFEVAETRGDLRDGQVQYWQVRLKIGFTLNG
ncbi:MAG: dodecin domain-containing protein [Myxococcales bacterium]|nr:dodecin domain-containing protein [Myxococcales bacterium]